MSETDSFIEEVTEEVRRDRLYGYARKYGWIVVLALILIVGGTAYSEWTKAQTESAAQARGDQLLDILEEQDEAARQDGIAALDLPEGDVIGPLLQAGGDADAAESALRSIMTSDQPDFVRDLAALKLALLDSVDAAEAEGILIDLSTPGRTYSAPAREFLGLHYLKTGEVDKTITLYSEAIEDAATPPGQIQRMTEVLVALGETPSLATGSAPDTQNGQ